MVCQEFNDLVKIKKKLEIINELNHNNIMKVIKIQFKCLDFTTYAINAVMEKAISDWNNEIKMDFILYSARLFVPLHTQSVKR